MRREFHSSASQHGEIVRYALNDRPTQEFFTCAKFFERKIILWTSGKFFLFCCSTKCFRSQSSDTIFSKQLGLLCISMGLGILFKNKGVNNEKKRRAKRVHQFRHQVGGLDGHVLEMVQEPGARVSVLFFFWIFVGEGIVSCDERRNAPIVYHAAGMWTSVRSHGKVVHADIQSLQTIADKSLTTGLQKAAYIISSLRSSGGGGSNYQLPYSRKNNPPAIQRE